MLSLYWFYLWAMNVFQLTGIKNIGGWFYLVLPPFKFLKLNRETQTENAEPISESPFLFVLYLQRE